MATKEKKRTPEVVQDELEKAVRHERALVEELRAIPEKLAAAERGDRVEDAIALRKRGEELPLHVFSASKARLRLVVEKAELELPGFDREIRRLAGEAEKQKAIADEARDKAQLATTEWYEAREGKSKAQRSLHGRREELASLGARGPDYDALRRLTDEIPEGSTARRESPMRIRQING